MAGRKACTMMVCAPSRVERLGDAAQVQAIVLHAEDARTAHAVERLEDDVAVLGMEGAHGLDAARHQRGRDVQRELEDGELFRVFAQRLRLVEDAGTFALGLLSRWVAYRYSASNGGSLRMTTAV
jgi:hypothetical protein